MGNLLCDYHGHVMDRLHRLSGAKCTPALSQEEERLEMAKALGVDNDPTASTHVTSSPNEKLTDSRRP